MANISPHIQYETFQLFLNSIGASDLPDRLTDLLLQYNYDLIDINGFFPITVQDADDKIHSAQFLILDGKSHHMQHDLHILPFHQKGTETSLTDSSQSALEHASLLELNEALKRAITDHPHDHCYFQLTFNLDNTKNNPNDHTLMVSFQQMTAYARIIYSLMNISSPHDLLTDRWKKTPLKKIRSMLYQYALNHAEISKLWVCIISTSLFVYYEIEGHQNEHIHQHKMESILKPYIHDPLLFVISPITECFDLESPEDQECLKHYALLYDRSKWQFWLINWFRIHKATTIVEIERTQAA